MYEKWKRIFYLIRNEGFSSVVIYAIRRILRYRNNVQYETKSLKEFLIMEKIDSVQKKSLVVLLSFNYSDRIDLCINSILDQDCYELLDILILDSSTDSTYDYLLEKWSKSNIDIRRIETKEFSHGGTRQLAIEYAKSRNYSYVIFIVQDAIAYNEKWASEILRPFSLDTKVSCVFSKQIPYDSHNPIARSVVNGVFKELSPNDDLIVHSTEIENLGTYFNSNVSAAYSLKSFDEGQFSFREMSYAEDRDIAHQIIDAGYLKVYNPLSQVIHSHDYRGAFNEFQRYFDDFYGVKNAVGYPGDSVKYWQIPKRVILQSWSHMKIVFLSSDLSIIKKLYWLPYAILVAFYRIVALYFSMNVKGDETFLSKFSRTEMLRELKVQELTFYHRWTTYILIFGLLVKYPFKGFTSGFKQMLLRDTSRGNAMEMREDSHSSEIKKVNEVKKITYPNQAYSFIKYYDPAKQNTISKVDYKNSRISWIIPEFGIGGGGHMIIFKMAKYLERKGYDNYFYVLPPKRWKNSSSALDVINKHYEEFDRASVKYLDLSNPHIIDSQFLIVTDWTTTYIGYILRNVNYKIHFIQDFEPYFFAKGTDYLLAEASYRMGYSFISNSKWLYEKITKEYMLKGHHIELGYDSNQYYNRTNWEDRETAIAFYSRMFTERRAVQFGLMALELVLEVLPKLKIYMFGDGNISNHLPDNFENLGLLTFKELNELYNKCSLGIALSTTNYSIIPQEMNACGLPVVDLLYDGNIVNYGDREGVILSNPDIHSLARVIIDLISDKVLLSRMSTFAIKEAKNYSWDVAGERFSEALEDYKN